jgi:hypothetical protein
MEGMVRWLMVLVVDGMAGMVVVMTATISQVSNSVSVTSFITVFIRVSSTL